MPLPTLTAQFSQPSRASARTAVSRCVAGMSYKSSVRRLPHALSVVMFGAGSVNPESLVLRLHTCLMNVNVPGGSSSPRSPLKYRLPSFNKRHPGGALPVFMSVILALSPSSAAAPSQASHELSASPHSEAGSQRPIEMQNLGLGCNKDSQTFHASGAPAYRTRSERPVHACRRNTSFRTCSQRTAKFARDRAQGLSQRVCASNISFALGAGIGLSFLDDAIRRGSFGKFLIWSVSTRSCIKELL